MFFILIMIHVLAIVWFFEFLPSTFTVEIIKGNTNNKKIKFNRHNIFNQD